MMTQTGRVAISSYVAKLRERVGHDLLLLPSVAVIPKDDAGRILLVRQSDSGRWATVGGTIEPDESPELAAVREAKEEAGIDVVLTLNRVLGGSEYIVEYANGDRCQYVSVVYDAKVASGEPRASDDETLEVGWFAPREIDELDMSEFTRALLRDLGYL